MSEIGDDTDTEAPSDPQEVRRLIRNSHALMRSVIRRSAESAAGLERYALHLEGRIDVIGRILLAAVHRPGIRFDLRRLIADELQDQRVSEGPHAWSLDGPPVAVGAAAAEVLALLFHELVTNSVEHGVLGLADGGELRVSWRIEGAGTGQAEAGQAEAGGNALLHLDWTERGAPAAPGREGFGTLVLQGMLRYQLEGTATRRLGPGGVRISLTLPLRNLAPAEAEAATV